MGRGAKPGERRGGRVKGVPNRKTVERMLVVDLRLEQFKTGEARLLAKEVLDGFMHQFFTAAEHYRPFDVDAGGKFTKRKKGSQQLYLQYADKAIEAATRLAPYQSPRLAAVAFAPTREGEDPRSGLESARRELARMIEGVAKRVLAPPINVTPTKVA